MVHKLQHHTLGVARRTTPEAHTRGAVRRARTPQTGRGTAPPSSRPTTAAPRALPRATGARRMQRPLVVQVQPLERRADLALRPTPLPTRPSPSVPQIDQRPVRARRAVEGAHAAQHARRGGERAQPARLV